ncbi:5-formyltetrahydrofolate cyclo-ligase [Marinibactrum halimedae]|uniref:5-formyltetrahydrofolate cyclo-ligase n=1 Tax=Marinibactrum halimedae TaxID=1444977 RepID=A0AA37T2G7_9GAMM|nr:5-formyltetrahydrofolate cyclo-ligase [Marinibactrum halimedae]MCD9457718.1 5-formyltetrahydrofolate cyclo-ligase [Marinibactrum halimedae]GLS24909.1 5-formyltetrahydrofolate cyclo-ligase [Marinibactrum halimedae]
MKEKNEIRRQMRAARRALTPEQQDQAAFGVMSQLSTQSCFLFSQHIGFYWASDGEVDLTYAMDFAQRLGKRCYLPVIGDGTKRVSPRMQFYEYRQGMPLRPNRFGILEPDRRFSRRIPVWCLNMVLMPLVSFDHFGGRLGMGGGFYDRAFAYRKSKTNTYLSPFSTPALIGVAHSCQASTRLPSDDWDVAMEGIVTESFAALCNNVL